MRLRPTRDFAMNLESVAMTDMVLNMFIFFFISFSLLYTFNPERLAKVPVKPPRVTTPVASTITDKPVVITMDHAGLLYVGEQAVTLATLAAAIQQALGRSARTTVLLRADRLVTIKDVVRAMEVAKQAGATDVSIAVVQSARPSAEPE